MVVTIQQERRTAVDQAVAPVPVRASQSSVGALAPGLNALAAEAQQFQDETDTADAKSADTDYANSIRQALYEDETGFMYSQGGDAINRRQSISERLDEEQKRILGELSPAAQARARDTMNARHQRALQSIDQHTSGQRLEYLDSASSARVQTTIQDAIYDPSLVAQSMRTTSQEIADMGARNGWSTEEIAARTRTAQTGIHSGIIDRIANVDPVEAMRYLRDNKDMMSGDEVAKIEGALMPRAYEHRGRQQGRAAANGITPELYQIASDNLGMNETDQREALSQFLADGGTNLDPSKTAWCAAYVNSVLSQAGSAGTGALNARSFLDWGNDVSDAPKQGDVVVLSRGDPNGWEGHVGFFDGYNEDGSVRILGGNQGGAANGGGGVSIASYPANKVLGFRRADAQQGGGMEQLLEIENPNERAAAISEYNLRSAHAEGQRKQQLSAAQDAAFQHIDGGGSVDDIPKEQRAALGQEAMTSLRSYGRSVASGVPVETDMGSYYALRRLQANNPETFRSMNLASYSDKLSRADMKSFMDMQQQPAGSVTSVAASTLMTTANRHMTAAGIDTNGEEGSDDAMTVASMQTRLLQWQDGFIMENNRKPTALEIDQQIGRELTPVLIDAPGWTGDSDRQEALLIDLQAMELSASQLAETDLSVGGVQIPSAVINEQIEALSAAGEDVNAYTLTQALISLMEGNQR